MFIAVEYNRGPASVADGYGGASSSIIQDILGSSNEFTGEQNVFNDIIARRLQIVSDRTRKRGLRRLRGSECKRLVSQLTPYHYTVDDRAAAGLLAQDVPEPYRTTAPDGTLSVDYLSLLAELWGAVRHLLRRRRLRSKMDPSKKRKMCTDEPVATTSPCSSP